MADREAQTLLILLVILILLPYVRDYTSIQV